MKKFIVFLFLFFLFSLQLVSAESITFTTYYPAPVGAYDRIRLVPRAAMTGSCSIGTLYVTTTGDLLYCQNDGFGNGIWVSGVWTQTGFNIYPTNTPNPSVKVGIGLTAPQFRFHIQDGGIIATGGTETLTTSGAGTRFIWYPLKAAFRAGRVDGTQWNDVNIGSYSAVGGGENNLGQGSWAGIIAGRNNTASGAYSFIGGGQSNTASGAHAGVVGGTNNTANGASSFIGGGQQNQVAVAGTHSAIIAGSTNRADGVKSFVGGGLNNTANAGANWSVVVAGTDNATGGGDLSLGLGIRAFVAGGQGHRANGVSSGIIAGTDNIASGSKSFVGGGQGNRAVGVWSGIIGGRDNAAGGNFSFIGGGQMGNASGPFTAIIAGNNHIANGFYAFVGGGQQNRAQADHAAVIAGNNNIANAPRTFIGGGQTNRASAEDAAVLGGMNNTASGLKSFIGGGDNNTASGSWAAVLGGADNLAGGDYSVAGGRNMRLTATANRSFAWGYSATAVNITAPDVFIIYANTVGVGLTNPSAKLHVNGNIKAILSGISGSSMRYNTNSSSREIGYDVAELFDTMEEVEPGDVLVIDEAPTLKLRKSHSPSDRVVGVVSTAPAIVFEGSQLQIAPAPGGFTQGTKPPVALAGRILCKVTTENGEIKPGDLLMPSSVEGHAMKALGNPKSRGSVVGMALEPFKQGPHGESTGKIIILVRLK